MFEFLLLQHASVADLVTTDSYGYGDVAVDAADADNCTLLLLLLLLLLMLLMLIT